MVALLKKFKGRVKSDLAKWERPERNEDVIFRDDVTNEFPESLELAVIVVWFFLSVP